MIQCPHCAGGIRTEPGKAARFCPYCGKSVMADAGLCDLDERVQKAGSPKEKYALIRAALDLEPDDFYANRALLFHGRLHEPMARGKGVDFSIIKCHLFSVFNPHDTADATSADARFEELLRGPQLLRTMALSPDADAFFDAYVRRLAYEYIDLFLRGDHRYSRMPFGIGRSLASTAGRCATPVRRMLEEIGATDRLSEPQRALFDAAVREGFARVFGRDAVALGAL